MSNSSPAYLDQVLGQLKTNSPFSYLDESRLNKWFSKAKLLKLKPGQPLVSPRQLHDRIYIIVKGEVRYLVEVDGEVNTIDRRGPGQILGWVSLLRGESCEWVTASEETLVIALSSIEFLSFIEDKSKFFEWFASLTQPQETYLVALAAIDQTPKRLKDWRSNLNSLLRSSLSVCVKPNQPFVPIPAPPGTTWHLSTPDIPGHYVGEQINEGQTLPVRPGFKLQYRVIGLPLISEVADGQSNAGLSIQAGEPLGELRSVTLQELGILEEDSLEDDVKYPIAKGSGPLNETLAVCEMLSLHHKVPFRRDNIKKILEDQFRRDKQLSIELIAALTEGLGLSTQLGTVKNRYLSSIEPPAIMMMEGIPIIIFSISADRVVYGHPIEGLCKHPISQFKNNFPEDVRFAIPRRVASSPTKRFGWNWFTPLLKKYRRSLILIFLASLLAQLFGLGIPLLIQQIIDKVLTQGNMSSLNVLGTVMIVLAIFQGLLLVLRTYIFVDTTDRMDLTLGSAVIDRLLSLPLSFFEKRPVGELSQRIGELNTIRNFLTGTALVSVLNLIFAAIYLIVMIIYSPLLTIVSLSTLPIYLLLVFGVAPIYRYLIKQRAKAQAKTQSHLIEVLSGIQTVKAQHFELTARWKWQDRYRDFVSEGFKGAVVGTTSGQIGSFLNQLSSLLVLWVGMWLVLQGDLTLGMLIAFRIISGNVTGPLLQLSSLYQGFQGVQVSMERLSDILDQNPELSRSEDIEQIAMPPIVGSIRFEDVKFRFDGKGPYQVDRVSLDIPSGSFVGIVGQSGSGKSTLMKLLPRLYEPESGRIFIDDYDINKVDLSSLRRQIGIVPQDSLLFEGTIAENIALNDTQASHESIIEASKLACAHDFIMGLGEGYASKIAERGSNLSGGQRQRIAIARTILANPQLLIMDEATSALDYNTEKQLCLNLQNWAMGRTVLFITHRLSSIKSSDTILVMHNGNLVEQGSHNELVQLGERYSALYKQQGE